MTEEAESLAVGPRAVRLAIRAAISGRSNSTGPGGPAWDHGDRHAGVAQPFQVAGNGPLSHVQVVGETTERESLRAGMQSLDEVLLTLHPSQGQVWVT